MSVTRESSPMLAQARASEERPEAQEQPAQAQPAGLERQSQALTPAEGQPQAHSLSAAERHQREAAPRTHGLYAARSGLALRARRVRRLVARMFNVMPWLDEVDRPAARGWAELEIIAAQVFTDLDTKGITSDKGEPRRLLAEYRQLKQAQLAYERELGMTPAARMSLRVGSARGRAFDAAAEAAQMRRDGDGD